MYIDEILEKLSSHKITVAEAKDKLDIFSIKYIENIARLDKFRELRRGIPEVVFAENKEYTQLIRIVFSIMEEKNNVVVSKIKAQDIARLLREVKKQKMYVRGGINCSSIMVYNKHFKKNVQGRVGILSAGTSDIGIAEEARIMTEAMGCEALTEYDVGISGIHRTIGAIEKLLRKKVRAIIAVAGMEGAMSSIVSSLVNVPVIGVPTSGGYGFGAGGIGAMTSMLQSCTLGLTIVNIDNGIGAGAFAALIARQSR
jgi:pyridinium-3,5-biscarboxylic acid mononucleotide synthase